MKFLPWSWSKVSTFDCPLRWSLKYQRQIEEAPSPPLEFGSAFHEFAALYVTACAERHVPADPDLAPPLIEQTLRSYGSRLTMDQTEEMRELAMTWARRTDIPADATVRAEVEFAINQDCEPRGWWDEDTYFRGRLDVLALGPGSRVRVRDHKTNWAISSDADKRAAAQLAIYAFLAFRLVPDVSEVEVETDYVRWGVRKSRVVTREEAEGAMRALEARMEAIVWTTEFLPRPGSSCGICGYKAVCPMANGEMAGAGTIFDEVSAINTASELTAITARRDELTTALKDWVDAHGPVTASDMVWAYHPATNYKYPVEEVATLLAEHERPPLSAMAVDATAVKKLLKDEKLGPRLEELRVANSYTKFGQKKAGEE